MDARRYCAASYRSIYRFCLHSAAIRLGEFVNRHHWHLDLAVGNFGNRYDCRLNPADVDRRADHRTGNRQWYFAYYLRWYC